MHEAVAKMLLPPQFSVGVELAERSERATVSETLVPFEHAINIPIAMTDEIPFKIVFRGNYPALVVIVGDFLGSAWDRTPNAPAHMRWKLFRMSRVE
jgi:hypothetical protein